VKNTREADAVNWAQVRDRIDRGETGDKKAVEDPAAAHSVPTPRQLARGPLGNTSPGLQRRKTPARRHAAAQGRTVTRPRRALVALALAAMAAASVVIAVALTLVP
jgi:hypothetical protein